MADVEMGEQQDLAIEKAVKHVTSAGETAQASTSRRILTTRKLEDQRDTVNPSASNTSKPLYPDTYIGPGPTTELSLMMDGLDFRGGGGRAGGNRKRRRDRGGRAIKQYDDDAEHGAKRSIEEDEGYERRPQRKPRYEQPIAARLRSELLTVGESPQSAQNDVAKLGNEIALNFDDDQVRGDLLDILIQLVVEQPLKIPFVSSIVLYANDKNAEPTKEIVFRAGRKAQGAVIEGNWRDLKLLLRFFALLQPILEGDGVLTFLDELFDRAVDLQTKSSKDTLGLELVKIILLTIPYLMTSNDPGLNNSVTELLGKTEIIANERHVLQPLVDPYPFQNDSNEDRSYLRQLQTQLQGQAEQGWPLRFIVRVYKPLGAENGDGVASSSTKHALPTIEFPSPLNPGSKLLFPEAFFSIYANQQTMTTPQANDIAGPLIRDTLVDTINILDFNRNAVAKFLVELDCYWAPGTFVKRGMPIDKLGLLEPEQSTWKPEDMALDAIFSQIFFLPTPEHKLVYYHSLTTEICRLSPSTIAPCLGRAMRYLFNNVQPMDMELNYRFMDWFAQHLSNFEFRWKWDEWRDILDHLDLHPQKAFIIGAIDKEIRLSFVKRIRDTLPKPYHELISEGKEKDTPDFKYKFESTPFAAEGQEILTLLRKKAPDTEIEAVIERIQQQATAHQLASPEVSSTDAYVTAICYIGSKSLSHMLSCIERCREYLVKISTSSSLAADQIIQSVVDYWADHPGIAVNIIDKLLNYTIVTPEGVLVWALGRDGIGGGAKLAEHWRYEMVAATMGKVTNRVRNIASHLVLSNASLSEEDREKVAEALKEERGKMVNLFEIILESVTPIWRGESDVFIEADFDGEQGALVKEWAAKWVGVFGRKQAVELALVSDEAVEARIEVAGTEAVWQERFDAEEQKRIDREEAEKAARREAEMKAEAEAAAAAAAAEKTMNGDGQNGEVENHHVVDNLDVDEGV